MDKSSILAVIPAREGSKRLPGKNTKLLSGKPLIQWTIEAALKSSYIKDVIVSSDSEHIIELARRLGALVPFKRPQELASDTARSVDVALHALNFTEVNSGKYDYLIFLQPTSPLRNYTHIDEALEQVLKNNLKSMVSVCEAEHNPLWCAELNQDTKKLDFSNVKDMLNVRSQDLPMFYRVNGAIYIVDCQKLRTEKQLIIPDNSFPFIMEQKYSIDIDTGFDFLVAETIQNSSC